MEQESFDFYQEALKAFDAPIPQPKKEEPASEPAAEVTEPAPQEKPKRKLNPWWAVALCAVLCLALVIGFGRGGRAKSRGENYVYGIALEYGDGYATVVIGDEIWYVELEGLQAPAAVPGEIFLNPPTQPIWVFYDGEPVETDQNGCTKKITATFWKTDPGLYVSQDEIEFDLDGDGRKEVWSLRYTRAIPSLYASSFVYRVDLTAKDAQGNTLHSVYFDLSEAMSMVFSDFGGKLSLVLYCDGIYEELDIRLEDGELTVYNGEEAVQLYEPLVPPMITLPPESVPEVLPRVTYTVQFYLANGQESTVMPPKTDLTENEAVGLKNRLDALIWTNGLDVSYKTLGGFTLTIGNQSYNYSFSRDGLLRNSGMITRIGATMMETLLKLMPCEKPAEDNYFACLENGDLARLQFGADGSAFIITSNYASTNNQLFAGRYATFGSYYLLALGEDLSQILVLRMGESSFQYVDSMSHQDMFRVTNDLGFHPQEKGGTFQLAIKDANGMFSISRTPAVLTAYETWHLRQFVDGCDWQPIMGVPAVHEMLCVFDLFDGTGNDITGGASYGLLSGCRLYNPETEMVATFEEESQWSLLVGYLCKQSEVQNALYSGTDQDGNTVEFLLRSSGSYLFEFRNTDGPPISGGGSYLRTGNSVILLGWDDGPTYLYLDVQNNKLVYDAACSTAGEVFSQITELMLFYLPVQDYREAVLSLTLDGKPHYSDASFSDTEAQLLLQMLQSMQWDTLDDAYEGVNVGQFAFYNAQPPYHELTLYSGMRLVWGDLETQLNKSQWISICRLMCDHGIYTDLALAGSVGGQSYRLNFNGEDHLFALSLRDENDDRVVGGPYAEFSKNIIVCYSFDGEVFILRKEGEGWLLLPDYNYIETFDIPNGTVFAEQPMSEDDVTA